MFYFSPRSTMLNNTQQSLTIQGFVLWGIVLHVCSGMSQAVEGCDHCEPHHTTPRETQIVVEGHATIHHPNSPAYDCL